jgi:hypothetical protein
MELFLLATNVTGKLKREGIPHYVYDSGGKGFHIQVWLDAPTTDAYEWYAIRHHTARWLLKEFMVKTVTRSGCPHWNIDPRKYNWVTPKRNGEYQGKGSVVRAIGGRKKSYKVLIPAIPSPFERRFRTKPEFPEVTFDKWRVPSVILDAVKSQPIRESTKKVGVDFTDAPVPICVTDLVERQYNGEHLEHIQRVAVVGYLYTNYVRQDGCLTERRREMLYELFSSDPNYDPDITRYQVDDIVRRLEQDPTRLMGCGFLRNIVDREFCPICKAVFKNRNNDLNPKP